MGVVQNCLTSFLMIFRSSHPEVFLVKGVLKICSKFPGEQPCRIVILIKLQSNFIEITLRYGYYPVNLLCIFRTLFTKNTPEWLLLDFIAMYSQLLQIFFKKATWFKLSSSILNFLLNTLLQYFQ